MIAHEIDYKIYGEEMQYVELELDPQETAIAESGAFMMMDDGIQMQTLFGDGSGNNGGGGLLGKTVKCWKADTHWGRIVHYCLYQLWTWQAPGKLCSALQW